MLRILRLSHLSIAVNRGSTYAIHAILRTGEKPLQTGSVVTLIKEREPVVFVCAAQKSESGVDEGAKALILDLTSLDDKGIIYLSELLVDIQSTLEVIVSPQVKAKKILSRSMKFINEINDEGKCLRVVLLDLPLSRCVVIVVLCLLKENPRLRS